MTSIHAELYDKPHRHAYGICPVTRQKGEWCPPQMGDVRSPCPALNTLANHGYINRDGKNLTFWGLVCGLREGYNLTTPLAIFLALGGFFLIRQWGIISLSDLARHDGVEHNASIAHHDAAPGDEYAPVAVDSGMVADIIAHVPLCEAGATRDALGAHHVMTPEDVGSLRVRREAGSPPLDAVHAEIARGEMAIVCGMWETVGARGFRGIPVAWLQEWLTAERLPREWERARTQGLLSTVRYARRIRAQMQRVRKHDESAPAVGSLFARMFPVPAWFIAHFLGHAPKRQGVMPTLTVPSASASITAVGTGTETERTTPVDSPPVVTIRIEGSQATLKGHRRVSSTHSDASSRPDSLLALDDAHDAASTPSSSRPPSRLDVDEKPDAALSD